MRKSTLFLIIFLTVFLYFYFSWYNKQVSASNTLDPKPIPDDSISKVDFVTTDNYANPQLSYYYYIPKKIIQGKNRSVPYLIMVPGLSGRGEDFVSQQFKDFAKKEGFVILAPSFVEDSNNGESQTSYQYPAAWSGAAMNKIMNAFDANQNLEPSRLYLLGFSAGAQFVERYSMLFPDYITACAVNSAGGMDMPVRNQPTKFFVAVGSQDIDDRKKVALDFYNTGQKLGMNVIYKQYNISHEFSDEEIKDELDFFRTVKNSQK